MSIKLNLGSYQFLLQEWVIEQKTEIVKSKQDSLLEELPDTTYENLFKINPSQVPQVSLWRASYVYTKVKFTQTTF